MKSIKFLLLVVLLMFSSVLSYSQEPATIIIECKKIIKGTDEVEIKLDREMKTKFWNEDYIKIVITVKAKRLNQNVAVRLARGKRYLVKALCIDSHSLQILIPNLSTPLIINGVQIEEDISCEIYVPASYKVTCPNTDGSIEIFNCDEVIMMGT